MDRRVFRPVWRCQGRHLHGPAAKGENGGVTPSRAEPDSIKGSSVLTEAQATDLLAGKYYVNIHTTTHKDGGNGKAT